MLSYFELYRHSNSIPFSIEGPSHLSFQLSHHFPHIPFYDSISISLTVNTGILPRTFTILFFVYQLIGILSSIFLGRDCNILFSETSVVMLDFIVISYVRLFTILPTPASFSWKLKYCVIEYGFSLLIWFGEFTTPRRRVMKRWDIC